MNTRTFIKHEDILPTMPYRLKGLNSGLRLNKLTENLKHTMILIHTYMFQEAWQNS